MATQETNFEKSKRINGFAQPDYLTERYKRENNDCTQTLDDLYIDRSKIEPVLIESVGDYIKYLEEYFKDEKETYFNPVFYRVHSDCNYYNVPSVLREGKVKDEKWYFNEFLRRYPDAFKECENTFEKLVVMQHYGSNSRLLDLTESPLATLGFACVKEGKFSKENDDSRYKFATVTVFRVPKDDVYDCLKNPDSSTVSVIANCANLDSDFSYGNVDMQYRKDGFMSYLQHFIYFKDIVRNSVIVRTRHNNPRIKNQKGAFLIVNANRLIDFGDKNFGISADEFTRAIINETSDEKHQLLNLLRLKEGKGKEVNINADFKDAIEWHFKFQKIEPYSLDNKIEEFRDDPFNLKRFYYKTKEGKQLVFFIPPKAKDKIRKQLELLGFGYDMIYPEVDTVFHEINRRKEEERKEETGNI